MSLLRRFELQLAGVKDRSEGTGSSEAKSAEVGQERAGAAASAALDQVAVGACRPGHVEVPPVETRVEPEKPAPPRVEPVRWVDPHVSGVYVLWSHRPTVRRPTRDLGLEGAGMSSERAVDRATSDRAAAGTWSPGHVLSTKPAAGEPPLTAVPCQRPGERSDGDLQRDGREERASIREASPSDLSPGRPRGAAGNMQPGSAAGFRCESTRWRAGTQGPAPLRGSLTLPGVSAWREALGWLSTLDPELAERAVFLDIETTGLGHTAGTIAFVIGLARVVGGAVEVEQFVLEKLSGEPGMLAALVGRVRPGALLVTFNGASFDLPVLRGRLRRYGLEAGALAGPHVDLLPLARRLWRGRGPDCRLATLERLQLGVSREGDLPGHAIPAMFWAALGDPRSGAEGIRQVVAHNLADMLAMPALALALARTIARPTDLDLALRVCDHLNAIGRRGAALAALAPWVAPLVAMDRPGAGDPAGQLRERRALLRAAELHRREGRADAAACLWEAVCWRFPGDKAAHAALSRDLERRRGDPAGALAVLAASEAPCPRRLARLQRMVQQVRSGRAGEALSSAGGPC